MKKKLVVLKLTKKELKALKAGRGIAGTGSAAQPGWIFNYASGYHVNPKTGAKIKATANDGWLLNYASAAKGGAKPPKAGPKKGGAK